LENKKRAIFKAITWRLFGFISTAVIVFVYSKNLKEALMVGAGIDGLKLFFYYLHERLWNRVQFGRTKTLEYQI